MPPPTAPLPALPAEPVKQAKSGSLFQNTSIFSNPKAVFSQVIGSRQPLAKRTSTGPEPAVNTSTPRGRDRAYSCTKGVAVDTPIDEMKENWGEPTMHDFHQQLYCPLRQMPFFKCSWSPSRFLCIIILVHKGLYDSGSCTTHLIRLTRFLLSYSHPGNGSHRSSSSQFSSCLILVSSSHHVLLVCSSNNCCFRLHVLLNFCLIYLILPFNSLPVIRSIDWTAG